MKKILINITDDSLFFSFYTREEDQKDLELTNTNIIKNEELIFTVEYIISNQKIIISFLNDLIKGNNVKEIVISNYELAKIIMPIINKLQIFISLRILEDSSLPYSLCELLLENNSINELSVYSIPPYMLEMLDRKIEIIETRSEILFTSNFMATNNLSQYSKIFYKTNVRVEKAFLENDFNDFETFCKINNYLRNINFYVYDEIMLKHVGEILQNSRIKNIKIFIQKNITSKEEAEKFKAFKNEFERKYNVDISIVYTENYLKDNIFKHLIVTFLKTISIVSIIIIGAVFGTIMFNNYLSSKKIDGINNDLDKIIKAALEKRETPVEDPIEIEEKEFIINNKFKALLEVNTDTVGWLKINNTNVDYPIVKTTDNSFYLTNDYYKKREYNGWVFMDYRNSVESLDKNTIIYGHNRYQSGVMFGTLANALKKNWYMDENNQIIKFDSLYEEFEFQIFSIYKVKKTSDYIETAFANDEAYLSFLEMIKSRSVYYFGIDIDENDKILTLSTCMDQNNRLVIHAVLKK